MLYVAIWYVSIRYEGEGRTAVLSSPSWSVHSKFCEECSSGTEVKMGHTHIYVYIYIIFDIVGTMYHLVIYMQSNKVHKVIFNE